MENEHGSPFKSATASLIDFVQIPWNSALIRAIFRVVVTFLFITSFLFPPAIIAQDALFDGYRIEPKYSPKPEIPDTIGVELIMNGGFEENNGLFAEGWSDDSEWAPVKVEYKIDTQDAFGGKAAQRIACTEYEGGSVQMMQSGLRIGMHKAYTVSFSAKGNVPIEVVVRQGAEPYAYFITKSFSLEREWKTFSFQGISPFSDREARLVFIFNEVGEIFLDNISVKQITSSERKDFYFQVSPPLERIPDLYFGLHVHYASSKSPLPPQTPWPFAKFSLWRLWDAHSAWPHLEPERGKWKFELFDDYLALAREHSVRLIIPLGLSPTWASSNPDQASAYNKELDPARPGLGFAAPPKSIEDFRNYVRIVAERSRGRGHYYELWNEINMHHFYSGTMDELISLHREAYDILKQVDPQNKLISSSVVGGVTFLDRLLTRGLGKYCDIIGIHLYTIGNDTLYDNQKMFMLNAFRAHEVLKKHGVDKPMWNTESGWNIESDNVPENNFPKRRRIFTELEASALVSQAYVYNWACNIRSFSLYTWDNSTMGMIHRKNNNNLKKCAYAYAEIGNWLRGYTMSKFYLLTDETWVSILENGPDRKYIVWNNSREVMLPVKDWSVSWAKSLFGEVRDISGISEIPVGPLPVLLSLSPLLRDDQ